MSNAYKKVLTDSDENPIHNILDDTLVFDRVNLCDATLRSKRLGCAHSGANINFERVLEQLEAALPQCTNQISELKNEFKLLITKIYTLDHKVGHLEHDIALCKLNSNAYEKDKLEQSLRLLKTEHIPLMNLLSKIKTDIEKLIKTEVNYSHI